MLLAALLLSAVVQAAIAQLDGAPGPLWTSLNATLQFTVSDNSTQNSSTTASLVNASVVARAPGWQHPALLARAASAGAAGVWSSAAGFHYNVSVSAVGAAGRWLRIGLAEVGIGRDGFSPLGSPRPTELHAHARACR